MWTVDRQPCQLLPLRHICTRIIYLSITTATLELFALESFPGSRVNLRYCIEIQPMQCFKFTRERGNPTLDFEIFAEYKPTRL